VYLDPTVKNKKTTYLIIDRPIVNPTGT
jgi:hypothetical protein